MILISNCCFPILSNCFFLTMLSLFVNVIHKTYYWFIDVFFNGKYIQMYIFCVNDGNMIGIYQNNKTIGKLLLMRCILTIKIHSDVHMLCKSWKYDGYLPK